MGTLVRVLIRATLYYRTPLKQTSNTTLQASKSGIPFNHYLNQLFLAIWTKNF